MLSIFVLGSYLNETELGRQFICAPSVVFYRAGAMHRNAVAAHGFEQVEIEFDPAWIGRAGLPDAPVKRWIAGDTAAECRRLLGACASSSPADLRMALIRFLACEATVHCRAQPWFEAIVDQLREDANIRLSELARKVSRHPAWIGPAYRRTSGEGLRETAARFRVERAAHLLRETNQPCAAVALEAGFCDQSHMNRNFQRILGRLPSEVRADREHFRSSGAPRRDHS
jgi:AraC-like DNA-binding protein